MTDGAGELSDEALRAAALALLDQGGDARARGVLEPALLELERDVSHWDASPGAVRAHRVLLGVRASDLALLERAPAVRDELARVLAAAVAARGHESLADLRVYWGLLEASPPRAASPYRGAAPAPAASAADRDAVRAALVALLDDLGEPALAHVVARSALALRRDRARTRVTLTLPRDAPARDPRRRSVLERAVTLLLAGRGDEPVALVVATR